MLTNIKYSWRKLLSRISKETSHTYGDGDLDYKRIRDFDPHTVKVEK